MSKPDGGAAFPLPEMANANGRRGMSLRDWFAGQIAAGLVSMGGWRPETVATTAYALADALLKEREK